MRVLFEEQVLNDQGSARWLTRIFDLFVDGVHQWVVEEQAAILQSRWFKSQGVDTQRIIRTQLDHADTSPSARPRVHRRLLRISLRLELTLEDWWVPAERAFHYLREPVTVLVENLECDGTFFRVLMQRYAEKKWDWLSPEERSTVFKRWNTARGDNCFFKVEHGGGANLPEMIRIFYDQAQPTDLPPRLLILVDSDLLTPAPTGQELSPRQGTTAHQCEAVCRALQAPADNQPRYFTGYRPNLIVLRKREVENYLPLPAIKRRAAQMPERIRAFERLNDFQKDHYDMKEGLQSSLVRDTPAPDAPAQWPWKEAQAHLAHRDLFSDVAHDDLRQLRIGFGSGIWEGFKEDHTVINRKTLSERAGHELDQIVSAVLAML